MTLGPRRSALQLGIPMGRFPDVVTTMFVTRVPEKGLEPSHHKAQEPKSCVSTNSTTPA